MIAAGIHAFGAALALGGIDEDSELPAAYSLLLEDGGNIFWVATHCAPMLVRSSSSGILASRSSSVEGSATLPRIAVFRALRDAVHAAHAILDHELGNIRGDVAEVAQGSVAAGMTLRATLSSASRSFSAVPLL